jgi:tetratricopeptide (TPR) repeat protein
VFPIFPVDYPFIEKGHRFTMDTNTQARPDTLELVRAFERTGQVIAGTAGVSPAMSAKRENRTDKAMFRILVTCLFLASFAVHAAAQQPTKSPTRSPPKTSTAPQVKAASTTAPNEIQQLITAGQTAHEQGRFEEAIRNFNRVIALSTNQPGNAAIANLMIGNAYMAQGKFGNAEVAFQRAVTLNPTSAESYNNLGEALGELKQYPRALEAFNKAISLDQKLLKAKYNQAVSYDRMGNFRYSEFVFRNLIRSSPTYSLSYDGLAVTLSKAGRAKEALAFHEKAIALDPQEPSYYFNCAISYLMMGNTAKAMEQQEKLKALDPAIADRLASVIVKHQM